MAIPSYWLMGGRLVAVADGTDQNPNSVILAWSCSDIVHASIQESHYRFCEIDCNIQLRQCTDIYNFLLDTH